MFLFSFPLAPNYIPGLHLRFLDTTVTNAVFLSFCKTLLLILNPSHTEESTGRAMGYPQEPGTVRQDQSSIFFHLGHEATSALLLWGPRVNALFPVLLPAQGSGLSPAQRGPCPRLLREPREPRPVPAALSGRCPAETGAAIHGPECPGPSERAQLPHGSREPGAEALAGLKVQDRHCPALCS